MRKNERVLANHDLSTLVEAVITKVHDTFAVAYPRKAVGDLTIGDGVTFTLDSWRAAEEPQCNQVVLLVNVMLYMRGWRAREAYPCTSHPVTPKKPRNRIE